MKNKLIHSGVDWKKVAYSQNRKWRSKNGPVVITNKSDKDSDSES